jgi:succinate-acetate transporter protein
VTVRLRGMPWGVALFLAYAVLILVGVGLSLPAVIDLAIDTPVSFPGLVVMALLAYTIFSITLVLQRKAAARTLALGLASLTVMPILLALANGLLVPAIGLAALAALLFRGLSRPAAQAWLDEL